MTHPLAGEQLTQLLARCEAAYDRGLGPKSLLAPPPTYVLLSFGTFADLARARMPATSLREVLKDKIIRSSLRHDAECIVEYVEWEEPARMETNGAWVQWPVYTDLPISERHRLVASTAAVEARAILERGERLGLWPAPLWDRPRKNAEFFGIETHG